MIKILIFFIVLMINLNADFKEGKEIFEKKCSSCHTGYVSFDLLKENFFEKDNKLLNLKAPTENMLAYAIMDSPKKIGDPSDIEMQQIEIEEFLKSYLEKPDRFNSICDEHLLKYYEKKPSMKDELSDEDFINLSYFFLDYKKNRPKNEEEKVLSKNYDENKFLREAKKENKIIMVYATSKTCYFCKKMNREVLQLEDVKKSINKDYIFIKVDVDEIKLPFNLQKVYKKITPTFFIVNQEGEYIKQYPGSWSKSDFLEILKENITK